MLSGNNYSGELAYVLLMFGNFQWNVLRGVENAGDNDYGTAQLWRIESINNLAEQLGIAPLPHPAFKLKLVNHTPELFLTKYAAPWVDIQSAKQEDVARSARTTAEGGTSGSSGGFDRYRAGFVTSEPVMILLCFKLKIMSSLFCHFTSVAVLTER
jgi:hypothetical protein